jgi:adenylate cyclase
VKPERENCAGVNGSRRDRRMLEALAAEERTAIRLATGTRIAAAVLILLYLLPQTALLSGLYLAGMAGLFLLNGFIQYAMAHSRWNRRWHRFAFITVDVALLTYAILVPNPFDPVMVPAPLYLRFPTFPYFYLLLAFAVFSFSPALVCYTGIATVVAWGIGVWWVTLQPGTLLPGDFAVRSLQDLVVRLANHYYADIPGAIQNGFVLLLVALVLAVVVSRSRRLVEQQARAERERANLARYFSPNVVDELADQDNPLGTARSQSVAVMFVDIVGFTALCETRPPTEVFDLLREFHARVERQVFVHDGTLDKYIGDGAMATFGTPRPGKRDVTNALICACALANEIAGWSEARQARGEPPITIGIGIHYGPVVLGDVGGERRLEFTVIGDTVNVASRLETLTRTLGVTIVVSQEVIDAARAERGGVGFDMPDPCPLFVVGPPQALRGRDGAIAVWTYGSAGMRRVSP